MTRLCLYMAAPLGGDVTANLARAKRWLTWLRIDAGEDDSDPAQREAGLVDAVTIVGKLDGVVLVGGRISSGMRREKDATTVAYDFTTLGDEPPVLAGPMSWAGYIETFGCDVDKCEAVPECTVCRLRKPPRGRSVAAEMASGRCSPDCAGFYLEPRAGHLWPGELARTREIEVES